MRFDRSVVLVFIFSLVCVGTTAAQWTQTSGPSGGHVYSLAVSGSNLFAGTNCGVFLSTNSGTSWTAVNSGLSNTTVYSLAVSGTTIFAGDVDGVSRSTNNGTSWTNASAGLPGMNVMALAVSGTNLFAGIDGGGVYLSPDNGATWSPVNTGITNLAVRCLAVSGTVIFAGTDGGGVYYSANNGTSWAPVNTGLTNLEVKSLAVSGTNVFAGTLGGGVFLTKNNGTSWTAVNTSLTNLYVNTFAVSGSNLFAGTNAGVFLSSNSGTSWKVATTGLGTIGVYAFAVSTTKLFAGTLSGLFLSTNSGTSWAGVNSGVVSSYVKTVLVNGTNMFAGTDAGLFLSANGGTTWTTINTGLTNLYVRALAVSGTHLFAGTTGGVFHSTNNGTSWAAVNTGLTNLDVLCLAVSGTTIFAGTNGGGVYLSTNNGTNWSVVNTGLTELNILSMVVSGTNLYAGTNGDGVFYSINNGASWLPVNNGLPDLRITALAVGGSAVFAGTQSGVFRSLNNGGSWTAANTGLANKNVHALAVTGSDYFAGTDDGVYLSTNAGTSWSASNTSLRNPPINALAFNSTTLFAATDGGGVWKRLLSDINAAGVPVPVSPADGSTDISTNPVIQWNPASAATSYQLQLSADIGFSAPIVNQSGLVSTSFPVTGLANSTIYYWRVNASNSLGTSGWAPVQSFTTSSASIIAPIDGSTGWTNPVKFIWAKSPTALAYTIQVSTDSLFGSLAVNQSIADTTYSASLSPSSQYYWRVRAENFGGAQSWTTAGFSTKLNVPVPAAPAQGAIDVILKPVVSWSTVLPSARYTIQLSNQMDFGTIVRTVDTTVSTLMLDSLSRASVYYWRVRAYVPGDTTAFSASRSFTTIPQIPNPPALVFPGNSSQSNAVNCVLRWQKNPNATSYRVQVSTSPIFSTVYRDTSVTDTLLRAMPFYVVNSQYFWRVQAVNTGGAGSFTDPFVFLTGTDTNRARLWSQSMNIGTSTAGNVRDTVVMITNTGNDDLQISSTACVTSNWIAVNSGLTGTKVISLAFNGSTLIAGTSGGVFVSANGGANWNAANNGMTGTYIASLAVLGTSVLAGTYGGGVFLSADNGANWTAANTGLLNTVIHSLFVKGTDLYAGTDGGAYRSIDQGKSWKAINTGMKGSYVDAFATIGSVIFAGNDAGVFRSSDNGASWTQVTNGLTNPLVYTLAAYGTSLFAGTGGGVFLSTDNGANWSAINTGLTGDAAAYSVYTLKVSGSTIYAGTNNGVYFSTNNGTNWYSVNSGLPSTNVYAIASGTPGLFVGTDGGGVFKPGVISFSTSLPTRLVPVGATAGINIHYNAVPAGNINDKLVIVSNSATSPDTVSIRGYGNSYGLSLIASSMTIGPVRIAQPKDTVITITNAGNQTLIVNSITSTNPLFSARPSTLTIAVGTSARDTLRYTPVSLGTDSTKIVIASNAATASDTLSLSGSSPYPILNAGMSQVSFGDVACNTMKQQVFRITNPSVNILTVDYISTSSSAFFASKGSMTVSSSDSIIVVFNPLAIGTYADTLVLHNNSASTVVRIPLSGASPSPSFSVAKSRLDFPQTKSLDSSSMMFVLKNTSISTLTINSVATASVSFAPRIRTPFTVNGGDSVSIPVVFKPSAFGTFLDTLTVATDAGIAKTAMSGSSPLPTIAVSVTSLGFGDVTAGTASGLSLKLFNSSVNTLNVDWIYTGTSRFAAGVPAASVKDSLTLTVTFSPDSMRAYADTLYLRNNSSTTLLKIPLTGASPQPILSVPSSVVNFGIIKKYQTAVQRLVLKSKSVNAVSVDSLVVRSRVFAVINTPMPSKIAKGDSIQVSLSFTPDSLRIYNDTLLIYNNSTQPVAVVVLSGAADPPTGIARESGDLPTTYSLSQNYPNPFNPSTTIRFGIPEAGAVTLKVYDIVGREVATLVNERLGPGVYHYAFNAAALASGMYIYRITAVTDAPAGRHGFTQVKTFLLLK